MSSEAATFHARSAPEVGELAPNSLGAMNFNVLGNLIDEVQVLQLNRGAEIGVFTADTSSYLLKRFQSLHLICVDPYLSYEAHEEARTSQNLSEAESIAQMRLAEFKTRVSLQKTTSVEAAPTVEDNSLDFVYIDALHTYEAVLSDLNAWYPKVRKGGLVTGHDVSWDGVREAVEQFMKQNNHSGCYSPPVSDLWYFQK